MSVLIKGLEIPRNCNYCNASLAMAAQCIMVQRLVLPSEYDVNKRHPSCPLREVPPHGDLIDRSKIVLEYSGLVKIPHFDFTGTAEYFAEQIRVQPVVISASEEKGGV